MTPWSKPIACLAAMALVVCLSVAAARAGTITMQTGVRVTMAGDTANLSVTITNRGDEAALRVSFSARMEDSLVSAEGPQSLGPNKRYTTKLQMPFSPTLPGTYAAIVRVQYYDAQNYPFSSVAWGIVSYKKFGPAKLKFIGSPGWTFPGSPPSFTLTNLVAKPRTVRLKLFTTRELALEQDIVELELAPNQSRRVEAVINNRGGLVGARYPVIGLASYVSNGVHYLTTSQALVRVGMLSDPLHKWRPWLWAAAGLLGLLILATLIIRRLKGGTP